MIKVGHDLSDLEIEQRYTALAGSLSLPAYFYPAIAEFADLGFPIRILDIGCGDGGLLSEVVKRAPGATCVGIEISSGRLRLAQQRLGARVILLQTSGKGFLPFDDRNFDLVFVTEVIEHLKDPVHFLNDVHRVLTPVGRLILSTPNSDAYPFWPQFAWLAEHTSSLTLFKHFLPFEHPLKTRQPIDTVLSFDEVRSMLDISGFAPDRVISRETLPFLFALPGFRGLVHRGHISRPLVDRIFNRVGLIKQGYRVFWDCVKKG
jgi:SAM-dependent methyltransferase